MENLFISNIQNFRGYSQFRDIRDFNNQIEQWMVEYKHIFTKSELLNLKRLIRYSASVPGVCNAKINTILQAIQERDFVYGASRSTFKRMLSKSKRIGLLKVEQLYRENESKSSNLYIFQRFTTIEPCRTEGEHSEPLTEQQTIVSENNTIEPSYKTGIQSKTSKQNINKRNKERLSSEFVSDRVPKKFSEFASFFWNDAQTIEQLWSRVQIASKKQSVLVSNDNELILEIAIDSLKQTVRAIKNRRKKKVQDIYAYFYGVLKNKFEDAKHEKGYQLAVEWWARE